MDKQSKQSFSWVDYKFILKILGLKSATADYACAWCKVCKGDRWNVDQPFEQFNKPPIGRTMKEIKEMCKQNPTKKNKYNYVCTREPLINIDLDHIVVDELHLMLRVIDILLENLINYALDWDRRAEIDLEDSKEMFI